MAKSPAVTEPSQTSATVTQESPENTSEAKDAMRKNLPEAQAILNPPDFHEDIQQRIERRAYELWEHRGCVENDALYDWLQAETELRPALGVPEQNQLTEK